MLSNSTLAAKHVTESEFSKRTQAGIDLSVTKIEKVISSKGFPLVLKNKTVIPKEMYQEIPLTTVNHENEKYEGWHLTKGVYSITLNEGINIPNNLQADVTHRSSIYRVGNVIKSPWWDAGFYCDNMNTTLIVETPMFVEKNARLAQVVFHEMHTAEETYNGQWQGLSSATHHTSSKG
jgi:deoxycytidine triphosphate deaminase